MSFSVLVVCLANICRSPMAAALLAQRLPDADVRSAGIEGMEGHSADPLACDVMRARGLDIATHRARRLDVSACVRADLILVMEDGQRRCVERRFPPTRGRVFNLGLHVPGEVSHPSRYFDVPDPYGGSRAVFERCADLMARGVDAWAHRIDASQAFLNAGVR